MIRSFPTPIRADKTQIKTDTSKHPYWEINVHIIWMFSLWWKCCHWYGTLDFSLEDRLGLMCIVDHVIARIVWLDDDWHWSVVFNDVYILNRYIDYMVDLSLFRSSSLPQTCSPAFGSDFGSTLPQQPNAPATNSNDLHIFNSFKLVLSV